MKLETFFQKFDQFAAAPDAVAKMRELVLRFAVTGRLSERRGGDAPVRELVETLSRTKARRTSNGRDEKSTVASGPAVDLPFRAPEHWAWVPLRAIGTMSGGMTPSKAKSAFWDGDVNWFSSKDIKADELIESGLKITREAAEETRLQIYSPGALVMVARSGILKRTFPVSILRVDATVNQDLKVLVPFIGGLERYIQIMLRGMTDFILTDLVKTGMTVQSLKYEEFEAQPFPLPPLAEQKRIVAKVDQLMTLCDRLDAQQKERESRHAVLSRASLARFADEPTPANLQFIFHKSYDIVPGDLRKAILTLAVRGKLVTQNPSDEPSKELLRIIRSEKLSLVDARLIKRTEPLEPDVSNEIPLPQSWTLAPLDAVCVSVTDGDHLPPPKAESGIPFLVISNIRWKGIDFSDCRYVSEEYFRKLEWIRKPRHGDILYTLVGSFGIPVTVHDVKPFCIQRHIGILRPSAHIENRYLAYALASDYVFQQATSIATGIAQKTVPLSGLRKITIPLPPLPEQRRIVAKVDQLMILVDQLEAQLTASGAAAANLMEAVLAELTARGGGASLSNPAEMLPSSQYA